MQMRFETNEMRVKELERQLKAARDRLQEARDQVDAVMNERVQLQTQLDEVCCRCIISHEYSLFALLCRNAIG